MSRPRLPDCAVEASPDDVAIVDATVAWFDEHQRDLPWRAPDRTPWGVLTSEVMLQQTPVRRVLPVWLAWMSEWPTPTSLAAADVADILRAWGRLGYPRRALNLHRAARAIVEQHGGRVPDEEAALRSLPGVGEYTAAAVVAFAFEQRSVVLDTNIRRVLERALGGCERPSVGLTVRERRRAAALVPASGPDAARWSIAVMELGALICTAARPQCDSCPIATSCEWRRRGCPSTPADKRRSQPFTGTNRQVRGILLGALRDSAEPVRVEDLQRTWPDGEQFAACLTSLVTDGLVEHLGDGRYRLGSGDGPVLTGL